MRRCVCDFSGGICGSSAAGANRVPFYRQDVGMSDTAMTSFLGSCLDLLQTLMEVKEVHFPSELSLR